MIFKICYFSIELSDVQETGEEDLTDGKTYITKRDQILECTKVNLVGIDSIIAIDIPSAPGKFVCFKNCLIVHNPDVLSLKERLSPSGLFKITFNEKKIAKKQPLGIAFAMFKRTRQTVFCNMKQISETFDVLVTRDRGSTDRVTS